MEAYELDVVFMDFEECYSADPRRAIAMVQLLLLDEFLRQKRIEFLEELFRKDPPGVKWQECLDNIVPQELVNVVKIVGELGCGRAISQGQVTAREISVLLNHPVALSQASKLLLSFEV